LRLRDAPSPQLRGLGVAGGHATYHHGLRASEVCGLRMFTSQRLLARLTFTNRP